MSTISKFNALVPPSDVITVKSALSSPLSQRELSKKLDDHLFQSMLMTSPANKARLLSVSTPHASSWLSVVPSVELSLHLDPAEFQAAVKWTGCRISVSILPRHHFGSSWSSCSVMQTW